jgi:hypothetical protein
MDAIIRFCFSGVDPEKIEDTDEYAKLFGQAKFIWDNITVTPAAKALNTLIK